MTSVKHSKPVLVQLGAPVPDIQLKWKKKKQPVSEEEAAKEDTIKKEKGDQSSEHSKEKEVPEVEAEPQEKYFDLKEINRSKTPDHFVFLFFFKDASDIEDREDVWTLRDEWDELQKIGGGLSVYGLSTNEKMEKLSLLKKKLKLPFDLLSDSMAEVPRNFIPANKLFAFGGMSKPKLNYGTLFVQDLVAKVYTDSWSMEELMNDMKRMSQNIAEGKSPIEQEKEEAEGTEDKAKTKKSQPFSFFRKPKKSSKDVTTAEKETSTNEMKTQSEGTTKGTDAQAQDQTTTEDKDAPSQTSSTNV